METFYKDFGAIKDDHFDGLIITGAPLGQVRSSEETFWDPLCEILGGLGSMSLQPCFYAGQFKPYVPYTAGQSSFAREAIGTIHTSC